MMRQIINARTSFGKLKGFLRVPVIFGVLLMAASIAVAACAPIIDVKTFSLGDSFTLAVGQNASIDGEDMTIRFIDVIADSRCPIGAKCIWQGEVACLVEITHSGTGEEKVLTHRGLTQDLSKAQFGSYEFTFSVEPYPEVGKEIEKSEYRLNLLVTKTPTLSG